MLLRSPRPPRDPDRSRRRWLAATVAVAALLAACGGGDDGAEGTDEGPTTTTGSSVEGTAAVEGTGDDSQPAGPSSSGSAGCGVEPDVDPIGQDRPGDVEQTFTTDEGVERTYRLARPDDYDPDGAVPLVLNLHGSGSDALQAGLYGDVPRAATDRGMVVVAPDAIEGQWELGNGADTDFLAALLDDVEARYCIDLDRVHGIGMSLGAFKVAAVGCALDGRFASLALVTVEVFPGDCAPMPVVAFHGTADPVAAYGEGGGTVDDAATVNPGLPGTLDNIGRWADSGGCDPEGVEQEVGDDVVHLVFQGCDDGVGVELYTIEGGGHTWPGSDIVIGPPEMTTSTIDATALSLDFFEAHPL